MTYEHWLWCWACRQLQTRKSPDLMLRTRPCLTLHVLYNLAVSFLKPTYIKLRWKPSGLLSYNKFATFFFYLKYYIGIYFHTFCQYWFIIVTRGREAWSGGYVLSQVFVWFCFSSYNIFHNQQFVNGIWNIDPTLLHWSIWEQINCRTVTESVDQQCRRG